MTWITRSGTLYEGDMQVGDRLATYAEVQAYQAKQLEPAILVAVQNALDAKAQSYGYTDLNSVAKYLGITDAAIAAAPAAVQSGMAHFRAEAQALSAWAAATWAQAYALLAQVQAGTAAMPSVAESIAMMPVYAEPAI